MLNETFNNIPEEEEISDEDTIVYTSGSNGKPLLASIEKEFDLNQVNVARKDTCDLSAQNWGADA